MSIQLRAMTAADIPAAHQLWQATDGVEVGDGDSPEDLARYLKRNPGLSTVALENDRMVGAVLCSHDGRRGFIYHMAVAAECRGRGIGQAIMKRSLAALKAEGIPRVLLLVAADNEGGRKFWLKTGWEEMPFAKSMGFDL
jgi:ribosomal protein S18 acetylase RimI-like enzyme